MTCAMYFFLLLFIGVCSAFPDKESNSSKYSFKRVATLANDNVLVEDTKNVKHYVISIQERKNFTDAAKICVGYGLKFLRVESAKQQEIIRALIKQFATQGPFWIAAKKMGDEWKWIDRSSIRRFFWDNGEPNNAKGSENCVEIYYNDAMWDDQSCDDEVYYICESGPDNKSNLFPQTKQ